MNDNLTTVVDPRSLTTGYTYNGFGDLIQQSSPDTGITVNSYDSGGNLATSTDARSQIGTYTYDAQNRVTQITYGDQTIALQMHKAYRLPSQDASPGMRLRVAKSLRADNDARS